MAALRVRFLHSGVTKAQAGIGLVVSHRPRRAAAERANL
jgi:hypothetical protein